MIGERGPSNFARIDFTKDECEAIAEIAEFFEQLAREQVMRMKHSPAKLEQLRASLRRARYKCSVAALIVKPNIVTADG